MFCTNNKSNDTGIGISALNNIQRGWLADAAAMLTAMEIGGKLRRVLHQLPALKIISPDQDIRQRHCTYHGSLPVRILQRAIDFECLCVTFEVGRNALTVK